MRIALHDRSIFEGARVSLIAVAQDVAPLAGRVLARLPLACGVESGPATAALARGRHFANDFIGSHIEQRLGHSGIGAVRNRVQNVGRIDSANVAHRHPNLMFVKGHFLVLLDTLTRDRVLVEQPGNDFTADQGLFDDLLDPARFDLGVEDALRIEDDQRPPFAESVATGGFDE